MLPLSGLETCHPQDLALDSGHGEAARGLGLPQTGVMWTGRPPCAGLSFLVLICPPTGPPSWLRFICPRHAHPGSFEENIKQIPRIWEGGAVVSYLEESQRQLHTTSASSRCISRLEPKSLPCQYWLGACLSWVPEAAALCFPVRC